MAQAQQQDDQSQRYKITAACGRESDPFSSQTQAEEQAHSHASMCPECGQDDVDVQPIDAQPTEVIEPDVSPTGDSTNGDETSQEPPKQMSSEPEIVDQPEPIGELPQVNDLEEQARSVIRNLDASDMNRFVWNPDADSSTVPYDPSNLPYDTLEPSAEAFDAFATIIEGQTDVQYSVVDVDFTETDEWLGCTVTIDKQTPQGSKRLVGVKSRTMTDKDHWRERLFAKARRNALSQDIPPTWISALLRQYKAMTHD